jgi:hypothetical protein
MYIFKWELLTFYFEKCYACKEWLPPPGKKQLRGSRDLSSRRRKGCWMWEYTEESMATNALVHFNKLTLEGGEEQQDFNACEAVPVCIVMTSLA